MTEIDWISGEILKDAAGEKLKMYLRRFVYECEALGCSDQTKGFIKDLRIDRTDRARSFMRSMFEKNSPAVTIRYCGDAATLLSYLREDGRDDDFILGEDEFVYFVASCNTLLSSSVSGLTAFKQTSKQGKRRKSKTKEIKVEFYRLDSVLRHIRNAFAHGQVRVSTLVSGEVYWSLQDRNSKGFITARMHLKQSTLDLWVTLLDTRDKRHKRSGKR